MAEASKQEKAAKDQESTGEFVKRLATKPQRRNGLRRPSSIARRRGA